MRENVDLVLTPRNSIGFAAIMTKCGRFLLSLALVVVGLGFFPCGGLANAKAAWRQIEDMTLTLDKFDTRESVMPSDQRAGFTALLEGQLEAFVERYPEDQRIPEAQVLLLHLAPNIARGFEIEFDYASWFADVESLRNSRDLGPAAKVRLEALWISYQLEQSLQGKLGAEQIDRLLEAMDEFVVEQRKDSRSVNFALVGSEFFVLRDQPERAKRILERALKNVRGKDRQMQNNVEQALAVLPYRTKPIDLKFKAADGSEVDLAKLKGKVVVVDFWASWCPPCRHESPELVELYQKYRADGLEIIGISLDESRKKMQAFADKVGMDWPHYFDGRGWRNKISTRFAISSIPAVWVIDRDGYMVNYKARGKLEKLVPRLLAKPMAVARR